LGAVTPGETLGTLYTVGVGSNKTKQHADASIFAPRFQTLTRARLVIASFKSDERGVIWKGCLCKISLKKKRKRCKGKKGGMYGGYLQGFYVDKDHVTFPHGPTWERRERGGGSRGVTFSEYSSLPPLSLRLSSLSLSLSLEWRLRQATWRRATRIFTHEPPLGTHT